MPAGDEVPPALTLRPLTRYPFQLLCPGDHPLAEAARLTLQQVIRHPLVLASETSSSRIQIERIFARHGLIGRMNVSMTASNLPLIMSYVGIGLGVALASTVINIKPPPRRRGQTALVLRDISALFGHEEVVLLQRQGRHELPHVKAFRELVEQSFDHSGEPPGPWRGRPR